MNKNFSKIRTITDVMISSILLVSGIVLVVLPTSVSVNVFGLLALIVGVLLLAVLKTGWQDTATKEHYCKKYMYFPKSSKTEILDALAHHVEDIDAPGDGKNGELRMDVYYNKQSHKAVICLFEYVPYSYEPVSPALECTTDKIKKLLE